MSSAASLAASSRATSLVWTLMPSQCGWRSSGESGLGVHHRAIEFEAEGITQNRGLQRTLIGELVPAIKVAGCRG